MALYTNKNLLVREQADEMTQTARNSYIRTERAKGIRLVIIPQERHIMCHQIVLSEEL